MEADFDVVNGTVYDQDDVVAVVKAVVQAVTPTFSNNLPRRGLKICYMNDLTHTGRHAELHNTYYGVAPYDLRLVRPTKFKVPPLVMLAEAASGAHRNTVPRQVLVDIVSALAGLGYNSQAGAALAAVDTAGLNIRIHAKAKRKAAFTLANLRGQIQAKGRVLEGHRDTVLEAEALIERRKQDIERCLADLKVLTDKLRAKETASSQGD